MDIGAKAMMAKFTAFKMAVVSEVVVAVDNTCQDISVYAKITHGVQGGNPDRPGKNIFKNRTYDLETSIHHDSVKINGHTINSAVIATMNYAKDIEFGSSQNMPYPFLKPSVEARSLVLPRELALALSRAKRVLK